MNRKPRDLKRDLDKLERTISIINTNNFIGLQERPETEEIDKILKRVRDAIDKSYKRAGNQVEARQGEEILQHMIIRERSFRDDLGTYNRTTGTPTTPNGETVDDNRVVAETWADERVLQLRKDAAYRGRTLGGSKNSDNNGG